MTKSMRTMSGRGSLLLVGLLLSLAACGDDDDSGGGTGGKSGAGGGGSLFGGASGTGGGPGGSGGASGGGAGGAGGATGPTLTEFGAMLGQSSCAQLSDCGGFLFKDFLGASCAALAQGAFEAATLPLLQQSIDSGRVVYDPSKVDACLADLKAQGCKVGSHYSEACEQALTGKVPDGAQCTINLDCVGGSACNPGTCPGTCAPRSAAGSPCLINEHCQDGLTCNKLTGKCAQPAATGASCGQGIGCDLDAFCLGADEVKKTPGTCKTYKEFYSATSGAACNLLQGPYCGEGLACAVVDPDKLTTQCVALAATGALCRSAIPDMCAPADYCDGLKAGDVKTTGTCKTRPGEGQACGATLLGATCASGLVCDDATKVCHAQLTNGATCADNGICLSGFCNADKVCASPAACKAP